MKLKIIMAFFITTLMFTSIFSSATINIDSGEDTEPFPNTAINKPEVQQFDNKISNYVPHDYLSSGIRPLIGGSTLDQYQTYGDCWVDTTYSVTKIAQRFRPQLEYLDRIELKVWLNFTLPVIDIIFYI